MLPLLVKLAIFSAVSDSNGINWNRQGAHVDGDNGTEPENVKRGRVSLKGYMPEYVYKQGGGQRE